MSENENIEAMLCSYVEGDLDAAGCAEIEKYLVSHPQYRPLIAELSRTRDLLKNLPRSAAPADLLETLSGQIERSALLGDDDPSRMKISASRLPHLAAWAAVLLLSTGLAAVIYRVLPANKSQPEVALLKAAPPQPIAATQATVDAIAKVSTDAEKAQIAQGPVIPDTTVPAASDQLAAATPPMQSTTDRVPAAAPMIASADTAMTGTVASGGTTVTNAIPDQQQLLGSIMGGDGIQLGQKMYVTLRATDAKVANAQVTQYLNTNGIAFESRPALVDARVSAGPLPAGPLPPLTPSESMAPSVMTAKSSDSFQGLLSQAHARDVGTVRRADAPAATQFAAAAAPPAGMSDAAAVPMDLDRDGYNVIVAHHLTSFQATRLMNDLSVKMSHGDLELSATSQAATTDQTISQQPLQTPPDVRSQSKDEFLYGVAAKKIAQVPSPATTPTTATSMATVFAGPKSGNDTILLPTSAPGVEAIPTVTSATQPVVIAGAPRNDGASNGAIQEQPIDVTIRVVDQSAATTNPATQAAVVSTQDAAPAIESPAAPTAVPAATMPTPTTAP